MFKSEGQKQRQTKYDLNLTVTNFFILFSSLSISFLNVSLFPLNIEKMMPSLTYCNLSHHTLTLQYMSLFSVLTLMLLTVACDQ